MLVLAMPRSHAPSLTTLTHRLVRDERLFARGDLVVCACSGGPDSTAMLHALCLLRRRVGHEVAALGVDHGLRVEAAAELDLAERVARDLGAPFDRIDVAVDAGPNLQARARRARHEALQRTAARAGAAVIAIGHTADDRAETVLLRLLRGAGPRGLAAMPPRAPSPFGGPGIDVVRPLLAAKRTDVMLHLQRHELSFASDPSNRDRRYLRARVRHELIPLLQEMSPRIVDHLCNLADMLSTHPDEATLADPTAGLGRAQRLAVRRALLAGRAGATVRVSGARDLRLIFCEKKPVLLDEQ
jgi:tRNA(Ile)-lysidine synthase